MKENCLTCKLRYKIEKLNYTAGRGCVHSMPGGFICMAFESDGIASWMILDPKDEICECYMPKEET